MKEINGYEGLYSVTEDGRVWSHRKGRFISLNYDRYGYLTAHLYKDSKRKIYRVHRLVLSTFSPIEGMNFLQVNHRDETTTNNHLSNLEWCDQQYNNCYGTRLERVAKTQSTSVYCVELDKVFHGIREAERQLGVDHGDISKCCKGKKKTCGGYTWRYVEVV